MCSYIYVLNWCILCECVRILIIKKNIYRTKYNKKTHIYKYIYILLSCMYICIHSIPNMFNKNIYIEEMHIHNLTEMKWKKKRNQTIMQNLKIILKKTNRERIYFEFFQFVENWNQWFLNVKKKLNVETHSFTYLILKKKKNKQKVLSLSIFLVVVKPSKYHDFLIVQLKVIFLN